MADTGQTENVANLPFTEVDVFCHEGLDGNPLAVVHDAGGLSDRQMQRMARWTNFSETTFLLPPADPAADYRVRIFTPEVELPFAGHPTIGTAHAWLEAGGEPRTDGRVVQECGIGLVELAERDGMLAFAAPELTRSGPVDDIDRTRTLAVLGVSDEEVLAMEWIDNGPGWIGVELGDAHLLSGLRPAPVDDQPAYVAVAAIGSDRPGVDVEVRCFFGSDLTEDPVTGSANAGFARWFAATGRVHFPYIVAQGMALGRDGRVHVSADDDGTIWIAGDSLTIVVGTVTVPPG